MRIFRLLAFGLTIALVACVAEPAAPPPYYAWYEGPYYPWYYPNYVYWPHVEIWGHYRSWHGGWHGGWHGYGHVHGHVHSHH